MDSRYMMDKSRVGVVDYSCRTGRSVLRHTPDKHGPTPYGHGSVLYTFVLDSASEGKSEHTSSKGKGQSSGGRLLHDTEKMGQGDQNDSGSIEGLRPPHCPGVNGLVPGGLMHLDIRNPVNQGQGKSPTERQPHSCHIPVPRNRKPSGHADKEVMAAAVLTSLSTSPMVLPPSSAPTVPEAASRGWKEVLSASYSSSTSGNWSWDASDQSVPSTPSPPLSNENNKNFLLSSNSDDISEDIHESTHFMFEDPIPRKRKNSMKVMFKCLWKNCEKVLSTSSGIQRHIRTLHLGRNNDSDYSDGEEDFYYSEIEVNMDSLTEGLSSLTPTSPTTVAPPPIFPSPLFDVPHSEHINVSGIPSDAPTLLSQSAPSALCHIRTDHAYQGPVNHVRTVSTGEKRPPAPSTHAAVTKSHALVTPATKATPGTRKPRGEAKKCRKVYGMEKKDMWCTACRWKKACQRFTD
ncbi:zinc finger protein 704 isoform X2 [Eucyclogobius newberryi]|uniref:zinc finger protein 704 isoform X2 n=1 Tax=Eucyclogobius newberryi TaxID=166745 RepID=UPI003B5CC5A0